MFQHLPTLPLRPSYSPRVSSAPGLAVGSPTVGVVVLATRLAPPAVFSCLLSSAPILSVTSLRPSRWRWPSFPASAPRLLALGRLGRLRLGFRPVGTEGASAPASPWALRRLVGIDRRQSSFGSGFLASPAPSARSAPRLPWFRPAFPSLPARPPAPASPSAAVTTLFGLRRGLRLFRVERLVGHLALAALAVLVGVADILCFGNLLRTRRRHRTRAWRRPRPSSRRWRCWHRARSPRSRLPRRHPAW